MHTNYAKNSILTRAWTWSIFAKSVTYNYLSWMMITPAICNSHNVVFIQHYCNYYPLLSFVIKMEVYTIKVYTEFSHDYTNIQKRSDSLHS